MNSKLIIKAGLLAGTLDIIAAFLNFYYKTGKNPTIVLKYIASAIFGKEAMTGGIEMLLTGLLLHFIIAFIFTLFFSVIYKMLWSWFKNTILIAILYGIFVWIVMNLAIVPLSKASQIPFSWSGLITNIIILIVCIGLPLSYLFRKNSQAI
ncbi:hypothetical protein [Pedobacter frigiditerrae]|uniref:hypothetical protein n=1 Tax=Pedobacter frigiditerrae TaxID=2530452 RepID=UPI00292F8B97|nr:hypothetical protein [Pedobacter frigiditerrae]